MENQQAIPEQQPIQEPTPVPNEWMKQELEELEKNKPEGEYPEALQLEEGKVTEFEIEFGKEFEKWESEDGIIKKIIPVVHGGQQKVLWVNVKNPLYRQLIEAGSTGQRTFKVMRTGQKKATRYTLVKE